MSEIDTNDFFIEHAKKHTQWVDRASQSPLVDIHGIASDEGTGTVWSLHTGKQMILHLLAWQ